MNSYVETVFMIEKRQIQQLSIIYLNINIGNSCYTTKTYKLAIYNLYQFIFI